MVSSTDSGLRRPVAAAHNHFRSNDDVRGFGVQIQEGSADIRNNLQSTRESANGQNAQNPEEPGETARENSQEGPTAGRRCRKNTKVSIKIAALNIKGNGHLNPSNGKNKWNHINQIMREEKIGILAVGEAHLNATRSNEIEQIFGKRLKVLFSSLPNNPNAAGIAIVLNKDITETQNIKMHEIIPGHALMIEALWHANECLSVLAIYAPSQNMAMNANFWQNIQNFFERNRRIKKPQIMLGDFNMVEDIIDRIPMRSDPNTTTNALDNLKMTLHMMDGWRQTYPTTTAFTFLRKSNGHQARLDRIYIKSNMFQKAYEWKISTVGIETDHRLVSMKLSSESGPDTGPGRWVWPEYLLKDKKLVEYIHIEGMKIQETLRELEQQGNRSDTNNAQMHWEDFKDKITKKARERAKIVIPHLKKKIEDLEAELNKLEVNTETNNEEKIFMMASLTEKLQGLEQQRHQATRNSIKIKSYLYGETISKYWTGLNKKQTSKLLIHRLIKPGSDSLNPEYEKSSQKMANLARDYHEQLQQDNAELDEIEREQALRTALEIIDIRVAEADEANLARKLSNTDTQDALQLSASGKAPGINGITYEVWKFLDMKYMEDYKSENPSFNIIEVMTKVFNDIETHGLIKDSNFAKSWMCPLYKKNDKAEIANYRPISLLNTDYKLMTKALSLKLAAAVPKIIHQDQAGFVPGRHIYDHIWLSKLIINLAEIEEIDGAMVALDQEKAYDRIKHDYLWRVLQQYGIPNQFIQTVKTLYDTAYTSVYINGRGSTPFKVTRGVRQGDPLSCLLFDIAIEPLAETLRKSDLIGFRIPGENRRVIATLFADDTTVYLSKEDDFGQLTNILNTWCLASGAKFNINKTEIIPIGKKDYRNALRTSRLMNGTMGTPIPNYIKIANEGESIRSLGALIGNEIGQVEPWSKILEKIDSSLERWGKSHPTMEGRRLIILMVIGAMTQYFAKVQGMPKIVEQKLEKRIRHFFWAEKTKTTINCQTIYAPKEMGGYNLLDIEARNEAISLMWLQSYLDFGEKRATWAAVADAIIAFHTPKNQSKISQEFKINIFLQSWQTCISKLPEDLKYMLKTANKYKVQLEGRALSRDIIRQMPIWHHSESQDIRKMYYSYESECLRKNHYIKTVYETETLAKNLQTANHKPRCNCSCISCRGCRLNVKCSNPHKCFLKAQALLNKLPEKWNPMNERPEDYENVETPLYDDRGLMPFDHRITQYGTLADAFRVFTEGEKHCKIPDLRWNDNYDNIPKIKAFTDGSCVNNGDSNASAGSGIYVAENSRYNRSIKIPSELSQSNQIGEIIAIKEVCEIIPRNTELHILSDSSTVVNGLVKNWKRWEDIGWIGIHNDWELQTTIARLLYRKAPTFLKWVKGHAGIEGNEAADKRADQGQKKPENSDIVDLTIPKEIKISGAKLNKLTQSLAYKAIKNCKIWSTDYQNALARPATDINLERAGEAAFALSEKYPTNQRIWLSLRHKDFSKKIQYFLWMTMHDGYKIGKYWRKISGYEDRGICQACNTEESMEHILTQCLALGQEQIWDLAGSLWKYKGLAWSKPVFGEILACGITNLRNEEGKYLRGESRFRRILISESAYLVWKLRNDRTINEKQISPSEIENRWRSAINARLEIDCLSTNPKYKSKSSSSQIVKQTWRKVLNHEENLPREWTREAGVLVGIRAGIG